MPPLSGRALHGKWVPVVLVAVHLALGMAAARRVGLTTDEMAHAATGYMAWTEADFRVDPIHPPLARMWMTWPLAIRDDLQPVLLRPEHLLWNRFMQPVAQWVHQTNDARGLLLWPRVLNLAWTAGLVVAVWWWLRRYGALAAALGGGIVALSPNLLAHGSLTTTDAGVTASFTLATIAFWRLTRCVNPLNLVLAGVAVAAALLCKFSGLLIVPVCVLLALGRLVCRIPVHWRLGKRVACRGHGAKSAAMAVTLLAVGVQAYALIWAAYGFRYSAGPAAPRVVRGDSGSNLTPDYWDLSPTDPNGLETPKEGLVLDALLAVRGRHLLPEAYVYGIVTLLYREAERPVYLFGDYKPKGSYWYYFPVAMLLKTPFPTLLVIAAGVFLTIRQILNRRADRATPQSPSRGRAWSPRGIPGNSLTFPAAVAAIAFAVAAMRSPMNIGLRHFLPVLPLLVLVAVPAFAAGLRRAKGGLGVAAGIGLWLLAANLWFCPHFLSYFNVLAQGPSTGHDYLADSNIDWGQGLPDLAEYLRDKGVGPVRLFYLGFDKPVEYGITAVPPYQRGRPPYEWAPGTYVVSLNYVKGIGVPDWTLGHDQSYLQLLRMASSGQVDPRLLGYCRNRFLARLRAPQPTIKPTALVGDSLFVYDLDASELAALLAPTQMAPTQRVP